ncbi:MAG: hypothetical protein ACYC00_19110 [Eubacteriales bacterium]
MACRKQTSEKELAEKQEEVEIMQTALGFRSPPWRIAEPKEVVKGSRIS